MGFYPAQASPPQVSSDGFGAAHVMKHDVVAVFEGARIPSELQQP